MPPRCRNGSRRSLRSWSTAAPEGDEWLHEIKFDGYRMHARLDRGASQAADPHRARLDAQVPADRGGRVGMSL